MPSTLVGTAALPSITHVGIPAEEYARRLRAVQDALAERGLQVGVGYGTPAMPGDPQYLSGFNPQVEDSAFVVSARGLWLVGGPEGEVQAADQARLGEFRNLEEFKLPGVGYIGKTFVSLRDVLDEAAGEPIRSVGVLTSPAVVSVQWLDLVREAVGGATNVSDASDILRMARYHKSDVELRCMQVSNRIADAALLAMLPLVRPGATELEVAARGDCVIKTLGAQGVGFSTIVLSGQRIDTIIGNASRKRIQDGEPVLLTVSARYNGYCSAIGRTVIAGEASHEQLELLDHGCNAYDLAVERLVAGAPARDGDLAARHHLAGLGLGDYHTYSVGHGSGLTECQEAQPLGANSDYAIPSGIAVMVDVGIFGHPVHHGFRFEDSFAIDHGGRTARLNDVPMRLHRMGV